MSAPDKDGMLSCVGGMFRTHIVQAAEEEIGNRLSDIAGVFKEYDVFNDKAYRNSSGGSSMSHSPIPGAIDESKETDSSAGEAQPKSSRERRREIMAKVPSLHEVTTFYRCELRRASRAKRRWSKRRWSKRTSHERRWSKRTSQRGCSLALRRAPCPHQPP
jgi:hypothetical protein